MILAFLTLLTAISISGIAAYFSIAGLIAIFSATPVPIAVMGSTLELAKLVAASWVYKNWLTAPKILKYYLTTAVVVLSAITSMGIFGYLSKSHIEQSLVSGSNYTELVILEQQEKVIKTRIDFLISQNEKSTNVSSRISRELNEAQKQLKEIINKKAPILREKNKLSAEIGPLKYITELIYGKSEEELINKAVRWVIITLIFVFDPLAILLLICANISLKQLKINPFNLKQIVKTDKSVRAPKDENKIKIDKSKIFEIT